jgi:hypothetical protein
MMDLNKIAPSDSVVETETVYRITSTFSFTEDQLDDPETRAFFDMLAKRSEVEEEEESTEEQPSQY